MGQANDPSNAAAAAFFRELAELLQLPVDTQHPLAAGVPFAGPGDVVCRVQVQAGGDFKAKPEVILPLDETEIRCLDPARLLTVQNVLLEQMQWMLCQSTEGLLQASPTTWSGSAQAVAEQLDLGVAAANMMLEMLRPHGAEPQAGPTTQ